MSADTKNADDEEQIETIDKVKRIVIYPEGFHTAEGFMKKVQDEYDPREMRVSERTTTTYMMEVDGDSCDLTETQWELWKDKDVEGVKVWEKEETNTTREPRHSPSYIAKEWLATEMGEQDIGDVHMREGSSFWKYDGDTVARTYCSFRDVKMVKKLPEQSPDDIFEEDSEERMALVVRIKPDGFPAEFEDELNQFIGGFFADIMKEYPVKEVRPVNCFEVEEKKTVCPRV